MSSQIVEDACAPGVEEAGVVFVNESGRYRLGGLWPEDIVRMQQEDSCGLVDYGLESDGYHYWAEFVRRD